MAPPIVHEALRSPGRPLDAAARNFFEPRLGRSLHGVRIHTDAQADRSAQALDADAYTLGSEIVFANGMAAGDTLRGARLLAHELAHVVQQSASQQPLRVQRQQRGRAAGWLPELNVILPPGVGLVTHIDRVATLVDVFGATLLEEHVRLIHADAAATQFTRTHGVPGIVALYDARRGRRLDVAAAQTALDNMPERYSRASLQRLRLQPTAETASFWFQDPASQSQGGAEGEILSSRAQRAQLHVEAPLSRIGRGVFVRFAYPETEVSRSGLSSRVRNAKQSILQAIAQLIADFDSLPPAADRAERRQQQTVRARLGEAIRGMDSSSPLNVLIATEPAPHELITGQVAALTDRVFVNLQDVGNPARLQGAIRMPLLMLQGGVVPTQRGAQPIPAASQADLQRTLLHEALHVMLIRQASDANAIREASRAQLIVQGSPSATPQFIELVRKYLIAQEEVFAYENEASLYPPVSPHKAEYDSWIVNVRRFLAQRQLTLNTVSRTLPVSQRVERRAVTWTISYQVPAGTADLSAAEIPSLDFLLSVYPLS